MVRDEVAQLADVYLYSLDDLAQIVQAGSDKRCAAVGQAETIIESGVKDFVHWLGTRETVPMIQALQAQAEGVEDMRAMLAETRDIVKQERIKPSAALPRVSASPPAPVAYTAGPAKSASPPPAAAPASRPMTSSW